MREDPDDRVTAPFARDQVVRRTVLACALEMFAEHGFHVTTLNDIADRAQLALATVREVFPTTDAIVVAYHAEQLLVLERLGSSATGPVGKRIGHVIHGHIESLRGQQVWLREIAGRFVDPSDPVSVFSGEHRADIERSTTVFARLIAGEVPEEAVRPAADALWMCFVSFLLLYIVDDDPDGSPTHQLLDDFLELLAPTLHLLATPSGRAMLASSPMGRRYFERVILALRGSGISALPRGIR